MRSVCTYLRTDSIRVWAVSRQGYFGIVEACRGRGCRCWCGAGAGAGSYGCWCRVLQMQMLLPATPPLLYAIFTGDGGRYLGNGVSSVAPGGDPAHRGATTSPRRHPARGARGEGGQRVPDVARGGASRSTCHVPRLGEMGEYCQLPVTSPNFTGWTQVMDRVHCCRHVVRILQVARGEALRGEGAQRVPDVVRCQVVRRCNVPDRRGATRTRPGRRSGWCWQIHVLCT